MFIDARELDHGQHIETDISIIGARTNAVVNKSIPANAICAGVPAKVLQTRK